MINKIKYQEFCKIETSVPIFSQPFWLDAVCGEENWDVLLFEKKGNIIATLPYYIKNRYGISYITQPKFTQILGPFIIYPKNIKHEKKLSFEKEVMNALIEQLEKLPVAFFQQAFNFKITNWLPFYWKGYKQTTNYTYRIEEISNIDDLLFNFHRSKQNHIRRALKQNLIIDYDLSAREFYNNHCLTLHKKRETISYSFELFNKMYNAVYINKTGRIIYAKDKEGNLHSALFVIWDHESAYNLINIIDPDFSYSRSSTLVVFEIIRFLSNKTKSFDFEGSMIENVEYSNRKYGTIQTPYFIIWKAYTKNPFLRFLINSKLLN